MSANANLPCHVIGIHESGAASLAPAAAAVLRDAQLVLGATRQLAAVASLLADDAERRDISGQLSALPGWVADAVSAGRSVAVLATGDPLCHGIASRLTRTLAERAPDVRVVVLPNVSTVQLACARFNLPWQAAALVSVHAADAGEWTPGARHDHGLAPLLRALARHDTLVCLTSPANSPDRIARALVAAGLGEAFRLDVAARLTAPDEALFADLAPAEAAVRRFPDPNVLIVRRVAPRVPRPVFGFDDTEYAQRQPRGDQAGGLLTKIEARAVSLAKLRLTAGAIVWDIGAGAGTVGLEAAGLCADGHVYAIEKNAADANNARANAQRFGVFNYTLAEGKAPDFLDGWPDPDAVFIGGSGGELATLISLCLRRLHPGGRLVMNFVTLENLATAAAVLTAAGAAWEVTQLSAARSQPILDMHRLAAQNPVWIVAATAVTRSAEENSA